MKAVPILTTITLLAFTTANTTVAAGKKAAQQKKAAVCQVSTPQAACPVPSTTISEADEANLLFLREEEKLARDVYLAMFALWQADIFSNIAASEQRHMDAILNLLDKYGLPDPAGEEGVFQNAELQTLYDDLIALGSTSLLDAMMVGALIEEVDIEDLQLSLATASSPDLLNVYSNLMSGSEQHLRAFVANIETITGEPYVARVLSEEAVSAILESPSKGRKGRR